MHMVEGEPPPETVSLRRDLLQRLVNGGCDLADQLVVRLMVSGRRAGPKRAFAMAQSIAEQPSTDAALLGAWTSCGAGATSLPHTSRRSTPNRPRINHDGSMIGKTRTSRQ